MRGIHGFSAATLSLLLASGVAPAFAQQDSAAAKAQDENAVKFRAMHWYEQGNVRLSPSSSTLALPTGCRAITDKDAAQASEIMNAATDPSLEGIAVCSDHSLVYFDFVSSGFVTLDDWGKIDPDGMIKDVAANTEEANKSAAEKGLSPLHVDGWIQKPTLDRSKNQASWSFAAHDDAGVKIVNAIALQLGRHGYEKLTWAGKAETFGTSDSLQRMMNGRSFDPGERYQDHIDTDKAAGYGIAALVGAVIGAKALKLAAAGGLALFFKPILAFLSVLLAKAWFVLLAPFVWLKSLIAKLRGRSTKAGS